MMGMDQALTISKAKVELIGECYSNAKSAETIEERAAWLKVAAMIPQVFERARAQAPESFRARIQTKERP